jgi:hypothetical protein
MSKSIGKGLMVSIVYVLAFLMLTACAEPIDRVITSPDLPTDTPDEIITETPEITPMPPTEAPIPTPEEGDLQGMIVRAQEDLAKRLELSVDKIELVEWKAVTWPDSSLGCPEPGQNYLPVLQDGYLMRFQAEDKVFQYHSGEDYAPFYCERPQEPYDEREAETGIGELQPTKEVSLAIPEPMQTPADQGSQDLISLAKEDLVARLGIDIYKIELLSFEAVTWRDGSLGCPQPGMGYIQVLIDGHRILLRAEGKVYHYHSGGNEAPFLCRNPQEPLSIRSEG